MRFIRIANHIALGVIIIIVKTKASIISIENKSSISNSLYLVDLLVDFLEVYRS